MQQQETMMTSLILNNWYGQVKRTGELINSLSDEQLMKETAPNRNRGIYLLGHLTAVHDNMFSLLGLGEQLYPALNAPFIKQPDKAVADLPAVKDLRMYWNNVNEALAKHFNSLQPDEWLQKHTAVSAEAFEKEPHRNRLNVLLSRLTHLSYHSGQLVYLKQ